MDPQSSLRKILDRLLERHGGPVTLEELFRLHDATTGDDSLSEVERVRLLDRVAADPEAAGRLRALMRFPDASEPGDEDAEVEERWAEFREQLPRARDSGGRRRVDVRPWLLAASFVLCGGLMFWAGRLGLPTGHGNPQIAQAWVNPEIVELMPFDPAGSVVRSGRTIPLSTTAEVLVIVLHAPTAELDEPLLLKVLDTNSAIVVQSPGLLPNAGGSFRVALPTELLKTGVYRLELLGSDGDLRHLFLIELDIARED